MGMMQIRGHTLLFLPTYWSCCVSERPSHWSHWLHSSWTGSLAPPSVLMPPHWSLHPSFPSADGKRTRRKDTCQITCQMPQDGVILHIRHVCGCTYLSSYLIHILNWKLSQRAKIPGQLLMMHSCVVGMYFNTISSWYTSCPTEVSTYKHKCYLQNSSFNLNFCHFLPVNLSQVISLANKDIFMNNVQILNC